MRGALGWVLASVLTFVVVSLAFLALARFATDPPEVSLLPGPSDQRPGEVLSLRVDEDALSGLTGEGRQRISVTVENRSREVLSEVSIVAAVLSEDTSRTTERLYSRKTGALVPGERREVDLAVDVPAVSAGPDYPEGSRNMIEVRATAPSGASTFETILLPVSGQ